MKKVLTITLFILTAAIFTTAFKNTGEQNSITVYERQQQRFEDFVSELNNFSRFIPDNETTAEQLQKQFLYVCEKYKAWEYLAEYHDPEFIKNFVNGAPLPRIVPNTANMETSEPNGLQVLDELIFSGDFEKNRTTIQIQTLNLKNQLEEYRMVKHAVYDRVVFEAVRLELIRIFTLGLTGFDVPASGRSINDAIVSLKAMQEDLLLYEKFFDKVDKDKSKEFYSTFKSFIYYLEQHNDFDNLDRLHVLKTYINPLYASLLYLHQQSGVEMMHETVSKSLMPPYNNMADNLFANDILDPFKYIRLSPSLASDKMTDLGRLLFFDPIMSKNLKRSCASCHHPDKAFTDGLPKSTALDFDGTVNRNAPTLINCVYSERFFHDMRATSLEGQIEHVLSNRKEFDMEMLDIVDRLKESKEYNDRFEEAFAKYSGKKIDPATIAFAISAYVSSLRGFNSDFDKYVRGEYVHLNESAKRGFNLFMGKAVCGTCHFAPVFNGTVPPLYKESESEVLGVPADPYAKKPVIDPDRGRIAGRLKEAAPFFEYSFKTPTIRNIAVTAPYMHNGSYKTLEDVLDFYKKGGGVGLGMELEHQTLPFDSLSLNKQEINDIIAFMKTLTDTAGMTHVPQTLPAFTGHPEWNERKVGGEY
ncbi:MAG: cytochrome-c peroxidase [Chitinophagales bacterium]|nr:hypothetical protein [Chitinophagaceae bacterium]MCB9063700.1 cytochrome-c peroxidase [Chitinophagales bacterium]